MAGKPRRNEHIDNRPMLKKKKLNKKKLYILNNNKIMLISSFIINNILSAPKPILKILKTFVFLKKKVFIANRHPGEKNKNKFHVLYSVFEKSRRLVYFVITTTFVCSATVSISVFHSTVDM